MPEKENDFIISMTAYDDFTLQMSHNGDVAEILIALMLFLSAVRESLTELYNKEITDKMMKMLFDKLMDENGLELTSTYYGTTENGEQIVIDKNILNLMKKFGAGEENS